MCLEGKENKVLHQRKGDDKTDSEKEKNILF